MHPQKIIDPSKKENKLIADKNGFTLVEAIVVIVLMTLVVAVGYMIFQSGLKSYITTYDKTSAQENFRLTIDYIENELSVAKEVIPMDIDYDALPLLASNQTIIYRKLGADGKYAVYLKTNTSDILIGYPGEDLSIIFQSENDGKILKVLYKMKGMDLTASSVYLENTLIDSTIYQARTGVLFTTYPVY